MWYLRLLFCFRVVCFDLGFAMLFVVNSIVRFILSSFVCATIVIG